MDIQNEIQKIYIAYFNRPADNGGLTFWTDQINAGQATLSDITSAFATTKEYRDLYSGSSAADVVAAVYQNLFGREPEPDGFAYWVTELESGRLGIGTVAYEALNGAQLSDKAIIENKAVAATAFTANLSDHNKDSDYTGEAIANARAWLSGIDETPASLSAALSQVGNIVPVEPATPVGPPRIFTFELGWDPEGGHEYVQPSEASVPSIDNFVLGHDKIQIVDISGKKVALLGPTLNYVEDWSMYDNDWETVYSPDAFLFAIFGALGHGANGGKDDSWAPLMAGETILLTYMTGGQSKTILFIDDGIPGDGSGMDNGAGTAVWNTDSDVVVNLTGLVGLKISADGLTVDGAFFA